MTVLKTKPMATHFGGELRTATMHILPGFAACCFGDKAWRIRTSGNNTTDRNKVTCKACRRRLEHADKYQLNKHAKELAALNKTLIGA